MEYQIVDVEYDDGITDVARIIRDELDFYVISTLEYSGNFCKFDEEYIAVPKESISGFYDTTDLEDTGLFRKLSNGVYESLDESDPDFEYDEDEDEDEYSSSSEDYESDISLYDGDSN